MGAHCVREEETEWNLCNRWCYYECVLAQKARKRALQHLSYILEVSLTHKVAVLCSKVSTFSFPTFTHRKQGCKAESIDRGCLRQFWLTGGYFATQKDLSSNAFWLATNFYVEPCKTYKDYSGRVSQRPCAIIYTRVAESALRCKTGISKA